MEAEVASSFAGNLGNELLGGLMPALSARRAYPAFLEAGHMPVIYKVRLCMNRPIKSSLKNGVSIQPQVSLGSWGTISSEPLQ